MPVRVRHLQARQGRPEFCVSSRHPQPVYSRSVSVLHACMVFVGPFIPTSEDPTARLQTTSSFCFLSKASADPHLDLFHGSECLLAQGCRGCCTGWLSCLSGQDHTPVSQCAHTLPAAPPFPAVSAVAAGLLVAVGSFFTPP